MGAVLFYHLTRSPAETVVGSLLPRALAQGWRVAIRGGDAARLARLDDWLWLNPDDGFVPHGRSGGPDDARQPVLLTTDSGMPNRPQALLALDRAEVAPEEAAALQRVWVLFDAGDAAAMEHARTQWRRLRAAGSTLEYWSEESGRWVQQKL